MSIKVTSVSKNYGTQKVLNDISFDAKNGEIIGFLGPNGAGKSTMMKILTGYLKPDEGEVLINDIDVLKNPLQAQKTIGYLPEHNALYTDMYVREYLHFCATIYKIIDFKNGSVKEQIETCLEKVGLQVEAHKKIHQLFLKFQTVCTDTRKIEPNCIFFCLKGEKYDANSFAEDALNKGAAFVIIDNDKYFQDERTILVKDVLTTLQELASYHRNFLELPIIALTGSNGKTTSKELIQVVLSKKFTARQ